MPAPQAALGGGAKGLQGAIFGGITPATEKLVEEGRAEIQKMDGMRRTIAESH